VLPASDHSLGLPRSLLSRDLLALRTCAYLRAIAYGRDYRPFAARPRDLSSSLRHFGRSVFSGRAAPPRNESETSRFDALTRNSEIPRNEDRNTNRRKKNGAIPPTRFHRREIKRLGMRVSSSSVLFFFFLSSLYDTPSKRELIELYSTDNSDDHERVTAGVSRGNKGTIKNPDGDSAMCS